MAVRVPWNVPCKIGKPRCDVNDSPGGISEHVAAHRWTPGQGACIRVQFGADMNRRHVAPAHGPGGQPTIIDVARHAGVSKSTVSNVLQGKASVAEPLRQKVVAAVAELGYRPHVGARSMRQPPRVLGVVVGDLTNPFHAELAANVEDEAARRSYSILLATTGGVGQREADRVRSLLGHRVAALIFLSAPHRNGRQLLDGSTPVVLASIAAPGFPCIAVDEARGTRLAVAHLASLGHTRIGFASATLVDELATERPRFKGFRAGMGAAGLNVAEAHLLRPPRSPASDDRLECLRAYVGQRERPTAVVAANDIMALELLAAAEAEGLRVPRDLSIVGFDDITISRWERVALTTVAQPMGAIARGAVELAISASDGTGRPVESITLDPELVVRGTTAPPR